MAKGEHAEHAGAAYLPLWTAGWHTEFVPETGKCLPLRPDLPAKHCVTSRQKALAAWRPRPACGLKGHLVVVRSGIGRILARTHISNPPALA